MERTNISSNTPWENIIGYSRAVRVGNIVEVAGTTAVDGTEYIGIGSAYEQMHFIMKKIAHALESAGAELRHVVRIRMFVTSPHVVDDVLRAHTEIFSAIRPASTLVVIDALIDPRLLVEVEASAIIHE